MTEIEKKAHDYFVKDCVEYDEDEYICENFEKAIEDAYKAGYEYAQKDLFEWTDREQLLKENAKLKTQIEKMRNCHNCKWNGLQLTKDCGIDCAKNNKDKWELAEC